MFEFETCSNWILSICIPNLYLRSSFNLLIDTNPRSLPLINESILSTRAPSCTMLHQNPKKNRAQCNRTNYVESRASSFLKMVGVRIHSGSCPSSRPLLSTTSIVLTEVCPSHFVQQRGLVSNWLIYGIMYSHWFSWSIVIYTVMTWVV